jgi:hypothetical protein
VETRLNARLHAAGGLQASDLLVGTLDTRFEPVLQVAPGTLLTCLLELYGSAYHLFEQTTVTLELLESSMADPIATAAAPLQTPSKRDKQLAQGEITVPEGSSRDYVVQAVVRTSGNTVATIRRKIRVAKETFTP